MALAQRDAEGAEALWRQALAQGGQDFRAMVGLASLLVARGELEEAEAIFLDAEKVFPGYDQTQLSAELRLTELYTRLGRQEDAMLAKERWLRWNAGEYAQRAEVAAWRQGRGEYVEAERLWAEAAEVDLFRRDQHRAWGECLFALERYDEAAREFQVARSVPPELDPDHWQASAAAPPGLNIGSLSEAEKLALPAEFVSGIPLSADARASLLAHEAQCWLNTGQRERAEGLARQALELAPGQKRANDVVNSLSADQER